MVGLGPLNTSSDTFPIIKMNEHKAGVWDEFKHPCHNGLRSRYRNILILWAFFPKSNASTFRNARLLADFSPAYARLPQFHNTRSLFLTPFSIRCHN